MIDTQEKEDLNPKEVPNTQEANSTKDYEYSDRLKVPYLEKESGDKFLKSERFDDALKCYAKVGMSMKILCEDKALNDLELKKYVSEVSIPTHLNMSYIYFKRQDFDNVIKFSSKILELLPDHTKARYRRCFSQISIGKLTEADRDLEILKQKLEGTSELKELISKYNEKLNKSKDDRTSFYKRFTKNLLSQEEKSQTKTQRLKSYLFVYIPHKIGKALQFIPDLICFPFKKCRKRKPRTE